MCISYQFRDTVLWKNSEVAIGDLVPGLSSFVVSHFCYQTSKSLPSLCLARYYNVLIGERVNVTIWQKKKGRKHVAQRSRSSCNVHEVSAPGYYSYCYYYLFLFYFFFFWRPKFEESIGFGYGLCSKTEFLANRFPDVFSGSSVLIILRQFVMHQSIETPAPRAPDPQDIPGSLTFTQC